MSRFILYDTCATDGPERSDSEPDRPQLGFDPVVVKAFLNLTGAYPVGTLVMLDTSELALVHSTSPDPRALSRPMVRIVSV